MRIGLEPLNRFETYFINRADQALALAEDVGGNCGVCLDIFHMNIEEADWAEAIRSAGDKLVDFHVADNNRMPCGQGALDWEKLMQTLDEVGYHGCVTVEFVATVDRSRISERTEITDASESEGSQGMEQFLRDHGTGTVPAEPLRPVRPGLDRPAEEGGGVGGSGRLTRTPRIALIATLDTKGEEAAYVRDRIRALGGRRW